jgi:predicted RNA-binding Zn ribbon-like protein
VAVGQAYHIPRAAPPGLLRLVQQFVNTVDEEHELDWLDRRWLAEHGLRGRDDLATAREAREALRALLLANNGEPVEPSAVEALNRISSDLGLAVRFDELGRTVLEPLEPRPLGTILAAVHTTMGDGSWSRLKACRNCCWVFYDASKNRSATWCSMQLCGNRLKTRAYRRRHSS